MIPQKSSPSYSAIHGVYNVEILATQPVDSPDLPATLQPPAAFHEFVHDEQVLKNICTSGQNKTFARRELGLLRLSFGLHKTLNGDREERFRQGTEDFSKVAKVDTHVHLAASFTASHLLGYIKKKFEECGDEVVLKDGKGKETSLRTLFAELGLTESRQLTVDSLDVQAEEGLFDRFDNFNAK